MFQQHKKVETETKWIKLGKTTEITFVGKETLAIINECHILFYDIGLKKNFIYNANCEEHGDGVQCLAGHRTMPMFAFAEKCYNPRILLFTYPNFTPISIIKGVCPDGYTNLVFSELEYIVSLSTFPQFIITVWCWRTGAKLAWKESGNTQSGQQLLRCSLSSPVIVSQMLEMSECLLLWEINVCSKRCMLSKNQVFLPEAKSCCGFIWAPEGILHIVTTNGDVYTVDAETHKAHLAIAWLTHNTDNANQKLDDKTLIEEASQYFETKNEGEEDKQGVTKNKETEDKNINNSNVSPCIAWFKGGIVVAGPDSYIKHFKRTSKVWKETWSILLNIQLVKLEACSLKDYLIGISDRGELYQYMPTMLTPSFERVQHYGSNFTHVCLIKPQCEMLATLSSNGILDVWDKTTGGHVGTMSLEAKYLCMVSSPKLPYIVLGRCDGVVDFLNVYCPESPQVLCQVSLCAWEIQDVQFTLSGNLLVAANTTNGDFFLIKVTFTPFNTEIIE
uniref:Cilia- and flagella-associated protein 43 n=1 Tax=Timema cristinae TaxID=61476 RepID=A0A7R9CF05_TIMCR|nr:unnamed protein product [Timema cristinae]